MQRARKRAQLADERRSQTKVGEVTREKPDRMLNTDSFLFIQSEQNRIE